MKSIWTFALVLLLALLFTFADAKPDALKRIRRQAGWTGGAIRPGYYDSRSDEYFANNRNNRRYWKPSSNSNEMYAYNLGSPHRA
ncbi:hypothetical protein Y032_0052g2227 [Ancylostoma ceylanicum]|uniref:Uncharacterized protein n=1 Tax=Ancylostoma ceylanicum TaxID=53326 RepID=A0A016U873_9BILA|nr:hypothetical protein Y032_0052g2227 [Ancylostoma ceylanicum]